MTKLMEWLLVGSILLGSWTAIVTESVKTSISSEWYIRWFPIIFVVLFGMFAAIIVTYRVFTFNNCEEAAIELQQQIKEAVKDLESKGIKLKQST